MMLAAGLMAAGLMAASLPTSVARAQGSVNADREARNLYQQGVNQYEAGNYEAAAAAFERAYSLSPRPLLQYNLANAYERLQRYPEAIAALRRYQQQAPISEHAELSSRIQRLEALQPQSTSDETLLISGVAMLAIGGAMAAAGAVFGALTFDIDGQLRGDDGLCASSGDGRTVCRGEAGGTLDEYAAFALAADIGLIGGGAVAATGLVLTLLGVTGATGGREEASLTPRLRVDQTGFGLDLGGVF